MTPGTWSPPRFLYYRYPDGSYVAVDPNGVPLPSQPQLEVSTSGGTTTVTDPWGNSIDEYELPEFTVHLVTIDQFLPTAKTVAVAVDADGKPIPLLDELQVTRDDPVNDVADVIMPDGSTLTVPQYDGTTDFFVHIEASSQDFAKGTVTYEMVAVDAKGVPLPVQPVLGGDPTDPTSIWAQWGTGSWSSPSVYQFPEFSVHLMSQGIPGAGAPKLVPVAVDRNGVPLPTQPPLQLDPLDPTKVTATLPDGTTIEPPAYEFPEFLVYVHSTTPMGHGAPSYVALAVDANGVPLPLQPYLEVDPANPDKVTATFADFTTYEPSPYTIPKDFSVHVVASGPPSAHGTTTFEAIAVDADGKPLPLQPHLEVDPLDPTKVTAIFPDGTSYQPPNLYPPPGPPPEVWPPPPTKASEEADSDEGETVDEAASADDEPAQAAGAGPAEADATADAEVGTAVGAEAGAEPAAETHEAEFGEPTSDQEAILVAGLVDQEGPAEVARVDIVDEARAAAETPTTAAPLAEETRLDDEAAPPTLADEEIAAAVPIVDEVSAPDLEPATATERAAEEGSFATEAAEIAEITPEVEVEEAEQTTIPDVAPETVIESAPEVVVESVAETVEPEPIEDTSQSTEAEEAWEDDA